MRWKVYRNFIQSRIRLHLWYQDITSVGTGVVSRDLVGQIIGSLSERIVLPPTVYDVEALACQRPIAFALEIGL